MNVMGWACSKNLETETACIILVGKPIERRRLRKRRQENNSKMDIKEADCEDRILGSCGVGNLRKLGTRFEVLKAADIQVEVFWIVVPCSVVVRYQR